MLAQYLTRTQQLLQNPAAPVSLYSTSDLTGFINEARGQVAGEGQCIRLLAPLATVASQRAYNFTSISVSGVSGAAGVINARQITVNVSDGAVMLAALPWEWFNQFYIAQTGAAQARPTSWAQLGQGAGVAGGATGTIYLDPIPDAIYTLNVDCALYPSPLASDGDPEAVPYLWTDAVPFFAAFLALLSAQSSARQADAEQMFKRYQMFVARARQFATPAVLPFQYEQASVVQPVAPGGVPVGKAA